MIGTGAFCTCHLARDVENGTMFAVKQVNKVMASTVHVLKYIRY